MTRPGRSRVGSRAGGARAGAAVLATVALAAALPGAGCGEADPATAAPTVTAVRRPVVEATRYHGRLEAVDRMVVRSPFDTSLLSWAEHGARVAAGEEVARVDATPHERRLEVIEAELEAARGELALSEFERLVVAQDWDDKVATAKRRARTARLRYDSLLAGRDWVAILRAERDQEIDRKRLARLRRDVELQRPQVARGFVSEAEMVALEAEIRQLDLGLQRRARELALLKAGPEKDKVADRALEVAQADAGVARVEERAKAQRRMAEGPVERSRDAIAQVEKNLAEKRSEVAATVLTAPADGVFLQNQEKQMWSGVQIAKGGRVYDSIPLGWVATGGRCRLKFWVPESHLTRFAVGTPLRFELLYDGARAYPAAVTALARVASFKADDARRVRWLEVTAEVGVPVEDYGAIRPGLNVIVTAETGDPAPVLALPAGALRGGAVRLAGGGLRPVEVGRVGGGWAEILGGLLPGEAVEVPGGPRGVARTAPVTRGELVDLYEGGGTLAARSQEKLYSIDPPEWQTKINWLAAEGSEVTTGEACVKMDPGRFENQIDSAEEALEQATASLAKIDVEAATGIRAAEEAIRVTRARRTHERAMLATVLAGSAPEEMAKEAAKLAELTVDETRLAKKLKVTREMQGRGFAGAREVAELEERWMRAAAAVEVQRLRKKLVDQGRTAAEKEVQRLVVRGVEATLAYQEKVLARTRQRAEIRRATARAKLRQAERDLAKKRAQLAGFVLRPTRSGTVVYLRHQEGGEEVPFKVGASARRGEAVVAVADLSRSLVEGLIAEDVARRVAPGQAARFWLPSFPETRYAARVASLGRLPVALPDAETEQGYPVVLEVLEKSSRLQPGVRVRFEVELLRLTDRLRVPLEALRREEGETLVVLADGTRRRVEVTARDRRFAAVGAGLEEGDRVRIP